MRNLRSSALLRQKLTVEGECKIGAELDLKPAASNHTSGAQTSTGAAPSPTQPSLVMSMEALTALIESSYPSDWQKAVQQPNITGRQLAYLTRRIVEMELSLWRGESEELTAEIVRAILQHSYCTVAMCATLATSRYPVIWLELAKSQKSDSESLRIVHRKNWKLYSQEYLNGKDDLLKNPKVKMARRIMNALAVNPHSPDEVLFELAQALNDCWDIIVSRPYCPKRILDYVLRRFEELPDTYTLLNRPRMLSYINRNGCADDEIRARVAAIRRFDNLVERVQDQTLTEDELVRIAKACAKTNKYPLQVQQIAHSLVWHTNATTNVMRELVRVPHSVVCYLVAQSDLADEQILMELVHRVDQLRVRNSVFYQATVKEILRHPNTTKVVIMALLKASPSRDVYSGVALTEKADDEVLRRVVDLIRVGVDGFSRNGEKSLSDWFPRSAVDEIMLHPYGGRPLYQYLRDTLRQCAWACQIIECDWDCINNGAYIWKGADPGALKTDPSVVRLQAGQAVMYDCYQGYMRAEALEKALHCEWLRAEQLDVLVYQFAFKTRTMFDWDEYLIADYRGDGKPRDRVLFERHRLALQHLLDHPELTDLSRAVLLNLKDARGEYLREYYQKAAKSAVEAELIWSANCVRIVL